MLYVKYLNGTKNLCTYIKKLRNAILTTMTIIYICSGQEGGMPSSDNEHHNKSRIYEKASARAETSRRELQNHAVRRAKSLYSHCTTARRHSKFIKDSNALEINGSFATDNTCSYRIIRIFWTPRNCTLRLHGAWHVWDVQKFKWNKNIVKLNSSIKTPQRELSAKATKNLSVITNLLKKGGEMEPTQADWKRRETVRASHLPRAPKTEEAGAGAGGWSEEVWHWCRY